MRRSLLLLKAPDPNTVYGPYAYGLSGYSEVLTEFNGGDARPAVAELSRRWWRRR
jgi:hypothetical protein